MTCYAAYDDEAPTYYCTRPKGHSGDHEASDDQTGERLHSWPRADWERASSQAGLASFERIRVHAPVTRERFCPRPDCGGRLEYGRRGDEPWSRCTSDTCDFEH